MNPIKIIESIDTAIESNDPHVPNTHPMHTQCGQCFDWTGEADRIDLKKFSL